MPEYIETGSTLSSNSQGKRDGSVQDEDFAWESRDFLRKLCIGKVRSHAVFKHIDKFDNFLEVLPPDYNSL